MHLAPSIFRLFFFSSLILVSETFIGQEKSTFKFIAPSVACDPIVPDSIQSVVPADEEAPFLSIDDSEMPYYKNGEEKMYKFFRKNFIMPHQFKKSGITGECRVSFIIQENGQVADIKVEKSLKPEIDEEILRVCSIMPGWVPQDY